MPIKTGLELFVYLHVEKRVDNILQFECSK